MRQAVYFYIFILGIVGVAVWAISNGSEFFPSRDFSSPPSSTASATANSPAAALEKKFQEPLSHLLLQLLVIIAASWLVGSMFVRCGQPFVVGEIAAGILLGPSFLGLLAPQAFEFIFPPSSMGTLKLLSQVGICLFMFVVGMELDLRYLRNKAHVAVVVSHSSIVIPYFLGVILAFFLYTQLAGDGVSFITFALFLGISLSVTAFPVLARILQERRLTKTNLGSLALTCAAVDDVTAWTILAFIVAVTQAGSMHASVFNLILVLTFIGIMVGGIRLLLPRLLRSSLAEDQSPSRGALVVIVCVVVASSLCTEIIGIHALFGAFLAGAITPAAGGFRQKLGVRLENFSSVLFLPLFFSFTGLRTQIGLLEDPSDWLLCLLIIAVAILGKLGGSSLAARTTGMSWRESLQLGALMNSRGLMELIVLNIGYDLGVLSARIFTMLVIMALVTTMLTGPLLSLLSKKPALVGRSLPAES